MLDHSLEIKRCVWNRIVLIRFHCNSAIKIPVTITFHVYFDAIEFNAWNRIAIFSDLALTTILARQNVSSKIISLHQPKFAYILFHEIVRFGRRLNGRTVEKLSEA